MNNRIPGVATILFDVGNTLTWVDLARAGSVLEEHGLPRPATDVAEAEAIARRQMYLAPAGTSDADRWAGYVTSIFRELGVETARLASLREAMFEVHRAEHLWRRVLPGTDAVLAELADRGYRLGVVSNSDGRVEPLLEEVGLARHFEVIVDSQIVGIEKPDPRIFALALVRMAANAESAIYVGDFPAVDVVGARRAGLRPVLLDPLDIGAKDDYPRLRALSELPGILPGRA
ncbi:MAG: HAD-IA family hydrolase [Gemmatimonadetes bacterium]|nr:HAD-IA family hydrolase [Gemmatimonadota bacterium]